MPTTIPITKTVTTEINKIVTTLADDKVTAIAANGDVYNVTVVATNPAVTAFMSYIQGLITAL
jgi:hypothetical protein